MLCFVTVSGSAALSCKAALRRTVWWRAVGEGTCHVTGGTPISMDAIDEVQVVVTPFDVRQTNFIGGGINAVTKSGTNTFKGTAYVYHNNENMHGNRVDNADLGERGTNRNTTYGFTLGGPIVKNKLFFFANAEYAKIPSVINRWRASEDGVADPDNYISEQPFWQQDFQPVVVHLYEHR